MTIPEYLLSQGWDLDPEFPKFFISPDDSLLVDISAGFGFAWEIHKFTDEDVEIEGRMVAKGRYKSTGLEGDSLADLIVALSELKR